MFNSSLDSELMWKRKRFTQSTKYDLRSFGAFPMVVISSVRNFQKFQNFQKVPETLGFLSCWGNSHSMRRCHGSGRRGNAVTDVTMRRKGERPGINARPPQSLSL